MEEAPEAQPVHETVEDLPAWLSALVGRKHQQPSQHDGSEIEQSAWYQAPASSVQLEPLQATMVAPDVTQVATEHVLRLRFALHSFSMDRCS